MFPTCSIFCPGRVRAALDIWKQYLSLIGCSSISSTRQQGSTMYDALHLHLLRLRSACEAPAKNRTAQQYWQTKQRRAQCDARVFYPLPAWGIFALEMFRTLATQRPQVCRGGRRQDKTNNHENQTIYVCVYVPIRAQLSSSSATAVHGIVYPFCHEAATGEASCRTIPTLLAAHNSAERKALPRPTR